MLGGVNMMIHAAGWLEGGLTASMEKFITRYRDAADLRRDLQPLDATMPTRSAFDAIAEVEPGGHFFAAAAHHGALPERAFYYAAGADWRISASWSEDGASRPPIRANAIWKRVLADFQPPAGADATGAILDDFIRRRTQEGGAAPVS